MTKILEIVSFFLWLICFFNEIFYVLKNNMEPYFKKIKSRILQVIRFDRLLLIIIFIIYADFKKDFLTFLVFSVICLYLYINKLYEQSKKGRLCALVRNNWQVLIIILILTGVPLGYYAITNNFIISGVIMMLYILFSYFIVGVSKLLSEFITKTNSKR